MASQKLIHQMSAAQFDRAFPNEEACCAYLVSKRWPEGVKCPRCQSEKVTALKTNPWHWQCYTCAAVSSYRFSHITGTIFENTNKPLKDWFRVALLIPANYFTGTFWLPFGGSGRRGGMGRLIYLPTSVLLPAGRNAAGKGSRCQKK